MNKLTGYLYAQPSYLSGVGRVLDLFGKFTEYNSSSSVDEADYHAIKADWKVIGDDLRQAVKVIEAEMIGERQLAVSGE